MIDKIIELLNRNKVDTYIINETVRESRELFFIKKNLDLSRGKSVKEIKLTVFRDMDSEDGRKRGQSDVFIYPGMSDTEITELINEAYNSASYVKNPFFELPDGEKRNVGVIKSNLSEISLMDAAKKMAEALYSVDTNKDVFINSSEIFATKNNVRTVTTSGCDISYTKYEIKGEFVAQAVLNGKDVEFYQGFCYENFDTALLSEKCKEALSIVQDRTKAEPAPDLSSYPVILYGKTVGDLLQFYVTRSNAAYVYPKYSPYKVDYNAQENATGEKLCIKFVPSVPYSSEGALMKERTLLSNGIVKNLHGKAAHLYYLGSEQTGTYSKIMSTNGTENLSNMLKEPHILIKNFSDFQMDPLDGQFGGEIRLAYLFDGKSTRIITGGSINGSIFDAEKNFVFSKEKYTDADYSGPIAVKI